MGALISLMSFTNGSLPPPPSSPPPGASASLPYPWQVAYAQDGRPYYINGNTHETSWTPPVSHQPPPPSYPGPPSYTPPQSFSSAGQANPQFAAQQQQQRAPDYSLKYPKVHPACQNRKEWTSCCHCKACTPNQAPESSTCAVCGHERCGRISGGFFSTWKLRCGTGALIITKWDCKYPK